MIHVPIDLPGQPISRANIADDLSYSGQPGIKKIVLLLMRIL